MSVDEGEPLLTRCRPLAQPALSAYEAGELEKLFKVLAQRQRLRILNRLMQARGEPLAVGEFVQVLRLTQPSVSYHLKLLRELGLVEREARGTSGFYRLNPAAFERIAPCSPCRQRWPEETQRARALSEAR